jgi:peptidoglycan/xylan/chitin deacetylase (PgdA/CDA1 family)
MTCSGCRVPVAALKTALFTLANAAGVSRRFAETAWRCRRLMILCYHGVSLADEHEWNPTLYISPRTLTRRLDALRRLGCTVLSLPEAVDRLYAENLPGRAVVLTFDDGYYDFKAKALPLLEERRYPATVYVTTQQWSGAITIEPLRTSYLSWRSIRGAVSPCSARALSVMTQSEVADVAGRGIAIEMHTHRHRLPLDVDGLLLDIRVNRDLIASTTGRVPRHLCYPDGVYYTAHLRHLRACGVETAATCDPGLAATSADPLLLPRFVDCEACSQATFEAWVTGVASWIPRRTHVAHPVHDVVYNHLGPNECVF